MDCDEIGEQGLIEAYVSGRVSEPLLEQLEAHYFGCENCAAHVHELRLARTALAGRANAIRAEQLPRQRVSSHWLSAFAIAAAILVAVLIWPTKTNERRSPQRQATPAYVELAKVDPPRYEPMVL